MKQIYKLTVTDNSMNKVGIIKGASLLIEATNKIENKKIHVIEINGEQLIRQVIINENKIVLKTKSTYEKYQDITLSTNDLNNMNLKILGKVKEVNYDPNKLFINNISNKKIPTINFSAWAWVPEAVEFYNNRELKNEIKNIFLSMPEEFQNKIINLPEPNKNKELIKRIELWKMILNKLSKKDYYIAVHIIYKFNINAIKRYRKIKGGCL